MSVKHFSLKGSRGQQRSSILDVYADGIIPATKSKLKRKMLKGQSQSQRMTYMALTTLIILFRFDADSFPSIFLPAGRCIMTR